jgi:hypothetical protein
VPYCSTWGEVNDKNTGQTKIFRLIFNLIKTYRLKTLFDSIQKQNSIKSHDCIKIFESIFKQTQSPDMITIKNRLYTKDQELDDLGIKKNLFYLKTNYFDFFSGGGIGLASGFIQSLVLCQRGLVLNINTSFISCYMGQDIEKNGS